MMAPQGLDIHFQEERLEQGRNFMNKLWNCSRFILMNIDDDTQLDISTLNISTLDETDQWILHKLNGIIQDVENSLDDYKINDAIKKIYNFVWRDYCDWYIEFSKSKIYGISDTDRKEVLSIAVYVLKNILKLLHPFAPFITEEIWSFFNNDEVLLATASYPKIISEFKFSKQKENIEFLMSVISSIRNIKTSLGVSPKNEVTILCRGSSDKTDILVKNKHHLSQLVNVGSIDFGENIEKPEQSATAVVENLEIFLPLKGLIDIKKEIERLESKINDIKARIDNVKRKLDNKNFISRAPEEIVNHEKKKYNSYLEDYNKLVENHSAVVSKK